jgi:hypothetical protein
MEERTRTLLGNSATGLSKTHLYNEFLSASGVLLFMLKLCTVAQTRTALGTSHSAHLPLSHAPHSPSRLMASTTSVSEKKKPILVLGGEFESRKRDSIHLSALCFRKWLCWFGDLQTSCREEHPRCEFIEARETRRSISG